jgi:hypothetical protein
MCIPPKKERPMSKKPTEHSADPIFNEEILFVWRKETPGTHSYQQVDAEGNEERTPVGTIYIKKDSMRKGVPQVLKVTIVGHGKA